VHEKNAQGGDGSMAQPRLLLPSSKLDKSFIDLLELVISKRPPGAKDSRIFLQPNPNWETTGQWFKTQPIGVHGFKKWMKESAELIGLETTSKRRRISNQSHRSTCVTLAMGVGGAETEVARITGHKDPRSLSSYVDPTAARRGELKDQAFLGIPKKTDLSTGRKITNHEEEHRILAKRGEGFFFGGGSNFNSCTIIFQASPLPPQSPQPPQPPQPPQSPQSPQPPQPPQPPPRTPLTDLFQIGHTPTTPTAPSAPTTAPTFSARFAAPSAPTTPTFSARFSTAPTTPLSSPPPPPTRPRKNTYQFYLPGASLPEFPPDSVKSLAEITENEKSEEEFFSTQILTLPTTIPWKDMEDDEEGEDQDQDQDSGSTQVLILGLD
jgi:hypothetical protein